MTRYLSVQQVESLHQRALSEHGGAPGIRDRGALESAVAQPRMTYGGQDLYPSLPEKASAIAYSLVMNHPFVDGNKRVGHAAMAVFLAANGLRLTGTTDQHEEVFLAVAANRMSRHEFARWIADHTDLAGN